MVRLTGVVAALCLCACYKPSFHDCAISCASGNGCPEDLSCDMSSHLCTSAGTCTGGGGDAHTDGTADSSGTDASFACWPFAPANYRPCDPDFPQPEPALVVTNGPTLINADDVACSYNNGTVCLRHFASITVVDKQIIVSGTRPLILVSDGDVTISDGVTFDSVALTAGPKCIAQTVPAASTIGAGGGGGGYGGGGGTGGSGVGVAVQPGGLAWGADALEPLVFGCPGVDGGAVSGGMQATRGYGGGAIQISSKTLVNVASTGFVSADGGGGAGGIGFSQAGGGGAGGGTGGSILLEGTRVGVAGKVCAVGGGGGQGGGFNFANGLPGGAGTGCAAGAAGAPNSGAGGGGAGGGLLAATDAQGHATNKGGGGGGGGVGRIRLHSPSQPTTTGATFVPMAVVQ